VLAAQAVGDEGREAAHHDAFGVDVDPLLLDLGRLQRSRGALQHDEGPGRRKTRPEPDGSGGGRGDRGSRAEGQCRLRRRFYNKYLILFSILNTVLKYLSVFLLPLREKVARQGRMRGVDATYSDFSPPDSSADEAL